MKFAKLIAAPVATIALSLISVSTFTGCDDVIGSDTVSIKKLGVPAIDSIELLSTTSAKIHVSGSYVRTEDFAGFVVFNQKPAEGEDSINASITAAHDSVVSSGDTTGIIERAIAVTINDIDVDQDWYVSSFDKKDRISQPVKATFYSRVSGDAAVNKYNRTTTVVTAQVGTGLDVDMETVASKSVEGTIHTKGNTAYATNTGADVIIEGTVAGGIGLTPIGGAVVFKVAASTQLTEPQVEAIYEASYKNEITENPAGTTFLAFAKGKSVRATKTSVPLYDLVAGDEFFVISSSYDVARLVVTTIGANAVTFTARKDSGKNAGLKIRNN